MSDSSEKPRSKFMQNLKEKAQQLQTEVVALVFAYRDPRTPWYAKACAALVVAYALSPVDLIPDFIPVLGYLDDLILVPAGIALALRMIPDQVMADAREKSKQASDLGGRIGKWGAVLTTSLWLAVLTVVGIFTVLLIKN